jgi:hypothetical protein
MPDLVAETYDGLLGRPADVYSFGVLLWQMVTGSQPWPELMPGQIVLGVQVSLLYTAVPAERSCGCCKAQWLTGKVALLVDGLLSLNCV